jgi:hypothetical protein
LCFIYFLFAIHWLSSITMFVVYFLSCFAIHWFFFSFTSSQVETRPYRANWRWPALSGVVVRKEATEKRRACCWRACANRGARTGCCWCVHLCVNVVRRFTPCLLSCLWEERKLMKMFFHFLFSTFVSVFNF